MNFAYKKGNICRPTFPNECVPTQSPKGLGLFSPTEYPIIVLVEKMLGGQGENNPQLFSPYHQRLREFWSRNRRKSTHPPGAVNLSEARYKKHLWHISPVVRWLEQGGKGVLLRGCWKNQPINVPLLGGTWSSLISGSPLKTVPWGAGGQGRGSHSCLGAIPPSVGEPSPRSAHSTQLT